MEQRKYRIAIAAVFLPILLISSLLQAQVRQQGEVVLQNSGRQPLAGVQVRAMGAVPATSDAAGRFDLHFSKSRPGQLLLLDEVYKDGYELVNEKALEQWTVSQSSKLPIVMCRKGALAAAQEKYYEIGRSHSMERYADACRQLDEQLAQNLLTEQQYNARLDKLSADYVKAMERLEAYAYALACYNRDDLDQMSIDALTLVEQGRLDEALEKYRDAQLGKLLQGLDFRHERERREMEAMIPSLRLNADLCCFAGGEENLQRAGEIYRSIALSDTTNASYAIDYASFLTEIAINLNEAQQWLSTALRHSTDSLQRAELYTGLGLLCTYIPDADAALRHLQKAVTIYEALIRQKKYSEDAYFNMSYTTYAIAESRYWLLMGKIANAANIMTKGVDYANKGFGLQPDKYAYPYLVFVSESIGAFHEFFIEYKLKTAENLQILKSLANAAAVVAQCTDKKQRIKTAQWLAGCYSTMSVASSNWMQAYESDLYADSCLMIVDKYMELNPVLFIKLKGECLLAKGQNLILSKDYAKAAQVLAEAYDILKDAPYAVKCIMNALNLLSIAAISLPEEQALPYSHIALEYMRSHPLAVDARKMLDVYWAYLFTRTMSGKELTNCEDMMLEMLDFIKKNDTSRNWLRNSHIKQLQYMLVGMYHLHGKHFTDREKKRQVLAAAIDIVGLYPQISDMEQNQLVIAALWEEIE